MSGHRADGVPFTVRSTTNGSLKFAAKDGAFDLATPNESLIVGFDVEAVTNALDLDAVAGNPIVIDDETNGASLKSFEDAIRSGSKLFDDEDKDGKLGSKESEDGAELGDGEGGP
jgi:hypothetical protein